MDRSIVYPGSIPLDTDLLASNRNTMVALGALIQAVLGSATAIDGLAVAPTAPAALAVTVAPGSLSQLATIDASAYGSLAADSATPLVKMGVNTAATTLTLAAPGTAGQSVVWLVQAALQEIDVNPVVLPYYNAANPAVAFLGPNNTGTAQPTLRAQRVQLQLRQGVPAATGSQTAPAVDTGWTGLALVTVAYGQTQVLAGHIAVMPSAPVLPFKLPALRPGFSQMQAFTTSGSFTVPTGVTRLRVRLAGGGGGGASSNATYSGGGGGAGGYAEGMYSVTPGSAIAVTVGAGGAGGVASDGAAGSASSFGALASATGGAGGNNNGGGQSGGLGGIGSGGAFNARGGYGNTGATTLTIGTGSGGASGFGGGGQAGSTAGYPGQAPGSGGGGGFNTNGINGGAGAAGIVIVEW